MARRLRLLPYPQRGLVGEAAAVGIGTAWLLPAPALLHGGGAFILILLVAVAVIAVPLVGLEIALGSSIQTGLPRGLRLTRRRWEPLAWWGQILAAVIAIAAVAVAAMGIASLVGDAPVRPGGETGDGAGLLEPTTLVAVIAVWLVIGWWLWRGPDRATQAAAVGAPIILAVALGAVLTIPHDDVVAADALARLLRPQWSAMLDSGTWLAALAHAAVITLAGAGVVAARSSRLPRTVDVTSVALQMTAATTGAHIVTGAALVLAAGGASGLAAGGLAAPDQFGVITGRVPIGGHAVVAALLAVGPPLAAMVITSAVVSSISERFVIPPRHVIMAGCLVAVAGGMVLLTAYGPEWCLLVVEGLTTSGLLPMAAMLALVTVWDPGFTAIHDHVAAYAALRTGTWWRSLLGSVVPPLLIGGMAARLIQGLESGRYLNQPGLIGLVVGLGAALLAIALARMRGRGIGS